jgi:hypothetical protein
MTKIPYKITPLYVMEHPEISFIYGDNLKRAGEDHWRCTWNKYPNCFPITTKRAPCNKQQDFFWDMELRTYEGIIIDEFTKIASAYPEPRYHVLIPGTGEWEDGSMMKNNAPRLYAVLMELYETLKSRYPFEWDYSNAP